MTSVVAMMVLLTLLWRGRVDAKRRGGVIVFPLER
jgi:hypothetical protein